MKAVVVELKNGRAAVLAPDGAVNFIKDNDYSVGQLLDIDTAPVLQKTAAYVRIHSKPIAAAAAAFIITGSLFGADCYAYSSVTLDINPSFRYTLNPFDKVIDVDACNEDAESFIDEMSSVKGMSLERAIGQALDILENEQYISKDTEAVITISSHAGRKAGLEAKAYRSVESWNGSRQDKPDASKVDLEVIELTDELSDRAEKEHKSPGRIYLDEKENKEEPETGIDFPETTEVPNSPQPDNKDGQEPSDPRESGQPEAMPSVPSKSEPGQSAGPPSSEAPQYGQSDPQPSEPPSSEPSRPEPGQSAEPPSSEAPQYGQPDPQPSDPPEYGQPDTQTGSPRDGQQGQERQ